MDNRETRAALDQHWAASDANDFERSTTFTDEDAVLEYPQSGERIRGRRTFSLSRTRSRTGSGSLCAGSSA